MAHPNRASSTLLSFSEPSIRHSGLQYHPPDTACTEHVPRPQTHALDGGEPVRFYQSHGYPIEATLHELPPQNQHLDSQARSSEEETDGVRVENVGEKKQRWSSESFGASPSKLATILVIWTIIIVAVVVGGGVGGAVVSGCSRRVDADKRYVTLPSLSLGPSFTPLTSSDSDAPGNGDEANSTTPYDLNNYRPAPQTAVNTTKLDCPAIDGNVHHTHAGPASFSLVCDRFYQNSERIWTVGRVNVYTPEECWEGCANMNQWTRQNLGWDDPPCDFASFSTLMADMWQSGRGNCLFFNKNNGKPTDDTWEEHSGTAVSAVLVQ